MAKELAYVDRQDLVDTADALRERLSTTDTYGISEFADAVREIQGGIDTSDANATEMDIVSDKSAYVNGVKIDGLISDKRGGYGPVFASFTLAEIATTGFSKQGIRIYGSTSGFDNGLVLNDNTSIGIDCEFSEFGTVQPESVLQGETFTSSAGFKEEGTLIVNKYYTGSSEPSSSLGNNGDLYLMVPASDPIDDDNEEV